ncbi:MAG: phosphate ABC transporter permease PstA [Nocardioides sp.]|uniref:phosphate ABC transporter permease PstA n=1 Tax=Nocardioides sp. TaxID=35761 RepID=UPI0039E27CF8
MSLSVDEPALVGSFSGVRLPRFAPALVILAALALAALLSLVLGWSWVAVPVFAAVFTVIGLPVWSAATEGRRAATDRLVTCLVWVTLLITLVPLVWVLVKTFAEGIPAISWHFLTSDMTSGLDPKTFKMVSGAGVKHAIIGTGLVTLGAIVISVPIGLMTAIYLVEYAGKRWIGRAITVLVDVMTGIPSIVAGLFAVALFTVLTGNPGTRIGLMGSIALSLLMIPTVVRGAEEMMRLVPSDLREASYALGVPKWRTILKVVLPTAFGGIVTGVVLAVSRVVGETAPLLVAVGSVDVVNTNLFSGRMTTLPVYIMNEYNGTVDDRKYAWGAALILIVIVMILNLAARIVGKIFAPKTGR